MTPDLWSPTTDEMARCARISNPNVEVVRQAHEAFNRPDLGVFDLDAFHRLADPDLVADWSRSNGLEAGIYSEEASTQRFRNTFFEAFERAVVKPPEFG
jgi:hypothetical protein